MAAEHGMTLYRDVIRRLLRSTEGYECQEAEGNFMLVFHCPVRAVQFCLQVDSCCSTGRQLLLIGKHLLLIGRNVSGTGVPKRSYASAWPVMCIWDGGQKWEEESQTAGPGKVAETMPVAWCDLLLSWTSTHAEHSH